jgi:TRAP-type C4-dicarboxylate transport system permease small subunit
MNKLKSALDRLLEWAGGLLLFIVTVLAMVQVVLRYVFNCAFIWSEEFSRLAFVWIIMLGAALGVSRRRHMTIDFFRRKLPPVMAAVLHLVLQLVGLGFLLVLVVQSFPLLELTSTEEYTTMPVPIMYCYLAATVGGTLMIFYWLFELAETVGGLWKSLPGSRKGD